MGKSVSVLIDGTALDPATFASLAELSVEENTQTASVATLRLALNQDPNGIWNYLDDARFAPLNKLTVKLGFNNGLGALGAAIGSLFGGGGSDGTSRVFDGYITHVEAEFDSSSGASTLAVRAMDSSVLLSFEDKVAVWPDCADSDIVSNILGTYGLAGDVTPTDTVHAEATTTVLQRGTDLAFVRKLAQRNGFEFFFDSSDDGTVTGHFRPPSLDGTPQKDLAMLFGDASNLRSFSTRLTAQRPLNVKVSQLDVDQASATVASAGDTLLTKLGATDQNSLIGGPLATLVTPADALAEMRVMGAPSSDSGELQTIAQAVRDEAGWFLSATGQVNTDAYATVLRAHQTVLVKGVGSTYSGTYYVTRVMHELKGTGAWVQRFEARRNARDVTGDEPFGGSGGGVSLAGL